MTCAHVVVSSTDGAVREPLWVAFPMASECPRRQVAEVFVEHSPPVKDLAVLVLQEPVPSGVETAPLRCPKPADLVEPSVVRHSGSLTEDPLGDYVGGHGRGCSCVWVGPPGHQVPLSRAAGIQRRGPVVGGLQGGGRGCGTGAQQRRRPGHHAAPGGPGSSRTKGLRTLAERFSAKVAGEVALEQWGWTLARDPEGIRHWRPRARGVSVESEHGFRFRGRRAALTRIVRWLDRAEPDRRVLVVTGSPGVGKSAVLGRIVTTADAAIRRVASARR